MLLAQQRRNPPNSALCHYLSEPLAAAGEALPPAGNRGQKRSWEAGGCEYFLPFSLAANVVKLEKVKHSLPRCWGEQSIQNTYLVHLCKYLYPAEVLLLSTRTWLAKEERAFSAEGSLQHLSYEVESSEAEVTPATSHKSASLTEKGTARCQGFLAIKTGGPGHKTTSARRRQAGPCVSCPALPSEGSWKAP